MKKSAKNLQKLDITPEDISIINKLEKGPILDRRAVYIFQILLLNYNFKNFISKIRKELKIPPKGFDTNNNKDWAVIKKREYIKPGYILKDLVTESSLYLGEAANKKITKFLEEEKIYRHIHGLGLFTDALVHSIIKKYIVFNNVSLFNKDIGIAMTTDYESEEMEDEIEIRFAASTTKEEMLDFINKNWEVIKILKEKILGKGGIKKRTKLKKKFARDVQIFNLYIDVINEERENKTAYTEWDIQGILSKQNIILNEGTIRSIMNKMKKSVEKINNL